MMSSHCSSTQGIFRSLWDCPNPAFMSSCMRRDFLRSVSGSDWSFPRSISKNGWMSRLRSGKSNNLAFRLGSRINALGSRNTTSPGNAGRGRFWGCFGHFEEISKIARAPSCLALSKSRVTQFWRLNFKFITERKKNYVRKNADQRHQNAR